MNIVYAASKLQQTHTGADTDCGNHTMQTIKWDIYGERGKKETNISVTNPM